MAKKFAAIDGLHTIFDFKVVEGVTTNEYDLTTFKDANVNHNTICFVSVDATDVDNVIGNHTIKENDRFIIVQNDVFSLYGSLQVEPTPEEQTWRPILVNGQEVIPAGEENSASVDFTTDSEFITTEGEFDVNTHTLAVKYNLDEEKLTEFILGFIPSVQDVNDGNLHIELEKEKVHTEEGGTERDIEIDQNTLSVKTTHEEVDPETEEPEEVEGDFSANTPFDHTVKIHYKGTADRVDWYAEGETRNVTSPNNSKAKKFVYVEGLSQYFDPSAQPPFVKVKNSANDIISQDSIVFITCALGDADNFENEEYYAGAHFIWTQGKMFSANTWMPIFTRQTEESPLKGITPPIENSPHGGRLIFQGRGGIIVDSDPNDHDRTANDPWAHERIITIDGSGLQGQGGNSVQWSQIQESGTPIATIVIDGQSQTVYAPEGGQGGSSVQWSQIQESGTPIATIVVDGVSQTVYAPEGQHFNVLTREDVEIIFNSNP